MVRHFGTKLRTSRAADSTPPFAAKVLDSSILDPIMSALVG